MRKPPRVNLQIARLTVFALALLSIGPIWLNGQPDERTVSQLVFHPVTTHGESPTFRVVSLRDSSGRELVNHCKGPVCSRFPKGVYKYVLKLDANGRVVEGNLQLYSTEQWVTLNLGAAVGEAGDFVGRPFKGHVLGLPNKGLDAPWARLQMLYAPHAEEVPINQKGEFSFDNVLEGKWMLFVLQGDQVLFHQVYTFPVSGAVEVDVRKKIVSAK